jgi:hypothetical protein
LEYFTLENEQGKAVLWKPITKDLPLWHTLGGYNDGRMIEALASKMGADPMAVAKAFGEISTRSGGFAITGGAGSDSTSPIVAQDLAPEIIPVYVRDFPLYDMIRKVPANGLSHTYLQQTSFTGTTDPNTISETGAVSDDANTYMRLTSNIAVFAIRRSVSLKAQFAGNAAGGPSSDLYGKEVQGGLTTIARDAQNETLRYQADVNNSATAYPNGGDKYSDPNGAYDGNGYNGLRYILNTQTPPENTFVADVTSTWSDQRVLRSARKMVNAIWDKGGKVDLLITDTNGAEALFEDQMALSRIMIPPKSMEIIPGFSVRAIDTDQGIVPVLVVPGKALGKWSPNGGTNLYRDIFGIWTEMLEMPYLGSPAPTVIRIPTAVNGQLVEVAIPFAMFGLAALAPQYFGRVSLKVQ